MRVAFILNQHNANLKSRGVLFSIHDEDVPVFRLLRLRARRAPGLIEDAKEVLLKLFDADAEYSADTLENIYDELEGVSKQVLAGDVTDTRAGEVLAAIARQEDLNGRIRRNVMDTRRAVSFMMRSKMLNAEQFEEARQILRDIESLDSHTAFLFDKINFLMDATVGFININQNKIIKIFSVASVALLPPTLIASVYGMNFQYMPELAPGMGLPLRAGADGGQCAGPHVVLPQARLVEIGFPLWRCAPFPPEGDASSGPAKPVPRGAGMGARQYRTPAVFAPQAKPKWLPALTGQALAAMNFIAFVRSPG